MNHLYKIFSLLILAPCTLFAEEVAPQAPNAAPNAVLGADHAITQTFIMIALAVVFFYFILWRPEQKKRKALEAQRSALKTGDRVVAMGVVGTVSKINKDTIVVHTGNAEVEFVKAAIQDVRPDEAKS